jgi:glycosyltransferase involved in cell wall biosynthesis
MRYNIRNDEIALGFVGRLSEEKGPEFAICALKRLIELGKKVKIVLIGDGPQKSMLEKITIGQNLNKHVIFAGFQSNVFDIFPGFDIFVLPSLTEGTPMALLEAMSYGIPTVASAVGGVPNIIKNRKSGVLVNPGKVDELVEAIDSLITNPEYCDEISVAGKEIVRQKYGLRRWIRSIESIYNELAKINSG